MDSLAQYVLTLIIFSSRNSIWFFSKSVWPFLFLAHVPCLSFTKHDWFIVQDCSFQKKRDSSFGQKHLYLMKGTRITCLVIAALLPGTTPKMVPFPKAASLPPSKFRFRLGLWLAFHPVCSQPCLYDKDMGRAWLPLQEDQPKGRGVL